MLVPLAGYRILVALDPVDLRKQANGLWAIAEQKLREDPRRGAVFVFSNRCRQLGQAPRIFAPIGAWVTVESVDYNPRRPTVFYDPEDLGLDLATLADTGERTWLESPAVQTLWQMLHGTSPEVQFSDSINQFRVAIEAPGVNRLAPPAPAPPSAEGA